MSLDQRTDRTTQDDDALVWQALLATRLVEGVALDLDWFFIARDEATARSLAGALGAAQLPAAVESYRERAGLLRRTTRWSIRSTTSVPFVTQKVVGDAADRMERLAAQCGAEFDGWEAHPAS